MVDLAGLITAGGTWSKHAQATLSALNDAVIYQVLGGYHKQAGGLAVYYPLSVQGSMELGIFKDICVSSYYLGLVNKVAFARASGGSWDEYDENIGTMRHWRTARARQSALTRCRALMKTASTASYCRRPL